MHLPEETKLNSVPRSFRKECFKSPAVKKMKGSDIPVVQGADTSVRWPTPFCCSDDVLTAAVVFGG